MFNNSFKYSSDSTVSQRIGIKYSALCALDNVPVVPRSYEALWQKIFTVKSLCRKMLGIWNQIHNPLKSGWSADDYKKAENDIWLLRTGKDDGIAASFDLWHVFSTLEPVLTSEDQCGTLLNDVADTTDEGVSGSKKLKQIKKHLHVKEEGLKEMRQMQVNTLCAD